MLGALSRADVFVPRWGSRGPNAFHPDSPPDDGVAQLVNASDIAERVVEGIDVIAGLMQERSMRSRSAAIGAKHFSSTRR